MSDRTAPALSKLDRLLPLLRGLSQSSARDQLIGEAEALQRAVNAFHMEAIRFRMYSVDRLINAAGDSREVREAFEELRHALESAGFHTRSHA